MRDLACPSICDSVTSRVPRTAEQFPPEEDVKGVFPFDYLFIKRLLLSILCTLALYRRSTRLSLPIWVRLTVWSLSSYDTNKHVLIGCHFRDHWRAFFRPFFPTRVDISDSFTNWKRERKKELAMGGRRPEPEVRRKLTSGVRLLPVQIVSPFFLGQGSLLTRWCTHTRCEKSPAFAFPIWLSNLFRRGRKKKNLVNRRLSMIQPRPVTSQQPLM